MKVTLPVESIVYVPSFGTTTLPSSSAPSRDGATVSSIGITTVLPFTLVVPALNTGVSDCFSPFSPIEVTSFPVGVTGNTTGVYLAVIGVPFLSSRFTVTPVACPVKSLLGVNVTVPSGATV